MKRILFFACLIGISASFVSCNEKEQNGAADEIIIYGNVIDRATGQPLYNVLIQEKNKVGGSTVTGNDGNYEFSLPLNGSSNGTYYLVASKDKYSSSEYELTMSQVDKNRRVKIDFQLVKESITYTGAVLDSKNQPIFDAHISAKFNRYYDIGSTTMTDINGVYTLELPRPQDGNEPLKQWSFRITAKKDGFTEVTHEVNQNADDMGKTVTLNFILKSNSVTISGKVVDQNGQPIANAQISDVIFYAGSWNSAEQYYYDLKGSKQLSTTQTDTNGNYTINSIVGLEVGNYDSHHHEYTCFKDGYKTQWQYLYTTKEDGGSLYNIDFTLIKK